MEGEYGERRRSGWKKKKGRDGMGEKQNKNKTRLDLIRDVRAEETSQKSRFSWKCVEVVFFPLFFFTGRRGESQRRLQQKRGLSVLVYQSRPGCLVTPQQSDWRERGVTQPYVAQPFLCEKQQRSGKI